MTLPSFLFGILVSTLYGAFFHFWRGGGPGRLSLYIILSWAGFWAGHAVAGLIGWTFLTIGPLNMGIATICSGIFLLGGHWLSKIEVERRE